MGEAQVPPPNGHEPIADLVPVIRRVVAARIRNPAQIDDLVQETLARVMAARHRVERDTLAPYAVATARNLIASGFQREQRARQHRAPAGRVGRQRSRARRTRRYCRAEAAVVNVALARLPQAEREVLLAHEVEGQDTAELAAGRGSTPGAIAAQLTRTRARLRVEYLLAQRGVDPPTDRCRPVLLALSAGDRRRQAELDVAGHLLACDFCADSSSPLFERRPARSDQDEESACRSPGTRTSSSPGRRRARSRRAPASPAPISP